MNDETSSENYKKFAQLCVLIEEYLDRKYAEKILGQGYDVNYQAPADVFFTLRKPHLIGSTALHVAMGNRDVFTYLLESGADVTVKNARGTTVLHQAASRIYDDYADVDWLQGRFESRLVNEYATLVLDAQVASNNPANPRDGYGVSHLHVACMANDARAVEFLLRNGASIDRTVNEDSPIFPGYGPLHVAVKCNCLEVVDVLLRHGVRADSMDAKGRTALEVAVERNMEIVDWMHVCEDTGAYYHHLSLYSDVRTRENSVIKLMMYDSVGGGGGLSHLHAACTLGDSSLAEHFLRQARDVDEPVPTKYPLWRGYTPLHFAAHFSVDALKALLRNGADVEARDAHGVTPLDICEGRFRVRDVLLVVASHPIWRSIVLSDGETKLTDLLEAMREPDGLGEFLDEPKLNVNSFVPLDSSIWPGCTILHLAVTFTETFAIASEHESRGTSKRRRPRESSTYLARLQVCLKRGADVTAQDAEGRTPLIRAFRSSGIDAVNLLLEFHGSARNPIDVDNLSHLHVACHAGNERVVGRLLSSGADANTTISRSFQWHENEHSFVGRYRSRNRRIVHHGSTPLHVAVARGSAGIASALLRGGADVNARDRDGLTPVHETLCARRDGDRIFHLLVSSRDLRTCDLACGLNYLHVAAYLDDAECVRRLIDMGVDVNASIESLDRSSELHSFATRYSGCTPLHVNLCKSKSRRDVSELLIRRGGADTFIGNSAGLNSLHESLRIGCNGNFVVSVVERDPNLQKRMIEDSGLTMLHVACWKIDVALARDRLSRGDDVNARVHRRSPIWPGWTPLHVLITRSAVVGDDRVLAILRLMMEAGADLSLTNDDELATMLHVIENDGNSTYANSSIASLLLRRTSCNQVNVDGISHFHVACIRSDLEAMDKFLRVGVDVDEAVNFFSAKYPGYAPLHFAVTAEGSVAAVALLLRHGANVHARDTCGNTPLHVAMKCGHLRETILKILVCAGADINATNIFGETPLEVLLKSNNSTSADIELFLEYDCRLNSFNPINDEGYMSHILAREYSHETSASTNLPLENILSCCDIVDIDAEGRTVIHNIVSTKKTWIGDYSDVLRKLLTRGCYVDQQDTFGRTALHVAVRFNNNEAVLGLLEAGADVNVIDANGQTPLITCLKLIDECNEYTNRFRQQLLVKILVFHIYKLQIAGLQVHEHNGEIAINWMEKSFIDKNAILLLRNEIEMTKCVMIGSSVTLYDFLSDTGVVANYPLMTYAERNSVDDFFRYDESNLIFNELNSLLNLQYRKALKRPFLNRVGTSALNAISNFPFPELCSRAILRYLTNEQLENLIKASSSDFRTSSLKNG